MRRIRIICAVVILVTGSVSLTFSKLSLAENTPIQIKTYLGTKDFEEYSAETIAEAFDMSQSGLPGGPRRDYSRKIQDVHRLKHGYKALLYRNVKQIANYSKEEWRIALVNKWLLKDINGQLIHTKQWPESYAVDIGNSDYQKWVANKIKEWLDEYSFFDGVFADVSLYPGVDEWLWDYAKKTIVNPRTGTYWKDEEIRQAYISLHKEIKKAIGSKLLICNGIFTGERFYKHFDDYKEVVLNSPLDGIMSEGTWQTWPSEQPWLESLKFLCWMEDNFLKKNVNRYFIPVINPVASKYSSIDIDREQLLLYGLTSTLLGIKTNQVYIGGLLWSKANDIREDKLKMLPLIRKLRNVNLGNPINDYYVVTGTRLYARDFTNGKILVNPTLKNYNISLDRDYYTLDEEIVSELTMGGHTGKILLIKSR